MYPLDQKNHVKWSQELWSLVTRVHQQINKIPYETDQALYGTPEHWTKYIEKMEAGDCDDYALAKREKLMEAGVPWQSLCPATCMVAGGGHAVLIIRTTRGAYVLCNNQQQVKPWKNLSIQGHRYEWLSWYDPVTSKWVAFFEDGVVS